MMMPVIDLHCDLLSYLESNPVRTPFDPASKTSYDQMQQGGVSLQTLAIFTHSRPGSHASGRKQLDILFQLENRFPSKYQLFDPKNLSFSGIQLIPAFENAYAFCEEEDPIEKGIAFLEQIVERFKILYISLTWDGENRFGGGVGSKIGLKEDGKRILDAMHNKTIAIDFSHTSDFLADDIINYIDKYGLDIPLIASHSNFRAITPMPRNLPDTLAKEIIARKGLIGINFFSPFIGKNAKSVLKHIQYALDLKGQDVLCFGADFFSEQDFAYIQKKYNIQSGFFPEINDASCYPYVLSLLRDELGLSQDLIKQISSKNVQDYLHRLSWY